MSVDGVEHKVNSDGLLQVEVVTTNLRRQLANKGYKLVPQDEVPIYTDQEKAERAGLMEEIETLSGNRVDRRRSLQQLRAMVIPLRAKANAKTEAGAKA
jgi:hypothetical protein